MTRPSSGYFAVATGGRTRGYWPRVDRVAERPDPDAGERALQRATAKLADQVLGRRR